MGCETSKHHVPGEGKYYCHNPDDSRIKREKNPSEIAEKKAGLPTRILEAVASTSPPSSVSP
jgi:hypothetical protein